MRELLQTICHSEGQHSLESFACGDKQDLVGRHTQHLPRGNRLNDLIKFAPTSPYYYCGFHPQEEPTRSKIRSLYDRSSIVLEVEKPPPPPRRQPYIVVTSTYSSDLATVPPSTGDTRPHRLGSPTQRIKNKRPKGRPKYYIYFRR